MVFSHRKRWAVVLHMKAHPTASFSAIARAHTVSVSFVSKWIQVYKATGAVEDRLRTGRPRVLSAAAGARALQLVSESTGGTANRIAFRLAAEGYPKVSRKTISRKLLRTGMQYGPAKTTPTLTGKHKEARVNFVKSNSRRAWAGVMFTDSKIFWSAPKQHSKVQQSWHHPQARPTQTFKRNSLKILVYMGVTFYGAT